MEKFSADLQEKIYAACIGLARVCATNPKTENTDSILLHALHEKNPNESLLNQIREEKDCISPGCKSCQSKCGNTDDVFPEMEKGSLKQKVFELCLQTTDIPLIYEGLARISYPADDAFYLDILRRLQKSLY